MGALGSAHFGAAVLWDRSEETTSASLSFERGGGQGKWCEHKTWDGPECKYRSYHEFGLRVPFGILSLEIAYDTEAAVRRRLPSSTRGLLRSVESKNRFEVYGAADALAEKREVAALPQLLIAAERDLNVFDAIVSIAKSAPLEAVPLLTPALASTNSYLGLEVARLLGELGTKATAAVPDLEWAFKNADPSSQPTLAFAIWRISGKCHSALQVLRRNLSPPASASVQAMTLFVIGEMGEKAALVIPDIVRVLETKPIAAVTSSAVTTLRQIGRRPEIAVPAIMSVVENTNYAGISVRASAIQALRVFGAAGVAPLVSILKGTNLQESAVAARALASMGPAAAWGLDVYLEELSRSDTRRIIMACDIVRNLREHAKAATPRLHVLLLHRSNGVKVHAASALSELDDYSAPVVYALLDCLNDRNFQDDELAFKTLQQVVKRNPDLQALLGRALPTRRRAAQFLEGRRSLARHNGFRWMDTRS